jgi:hypothetical protein
MPRNWKRVACIPVLAMTATAGTLCVMATVLSRPEAVLVQTFGAGLAAKSRTLEQAATPKLADSPYFWLSKSEPERAVGLAQPVKLGDRITVSSQSGEHSVLEVIDIRDLDGDVTHASATMPRLVMVSCKMLGSPGDRVVRFIVETNEPDSAALASPSPRSL